MKIRPFFYFAPDETPASGGTFFDRTPLANASEPSDPPMEAAPDAEIDAVPEAESTDAGTDNESTANEGEDAASAETVAGEEPAKTKELVPPVEKPAEPSPYEKSLVAAAKLLGITETDPAKIPAAIDAHQAAIAQKAEAESAAATEKARQDRIASIDKKVADELAVLAHSTIKGELTSLGWDTSVLETPNWFNDPENVDILAAYNEAKIAEGEKPHWNDLFESRKAAEIGKLTEGDARFSKLFEEYPTADRTVLSDLKRFGADDALLSHVAARIHAAVQAHTSTLNSDAKAKDAELMALRETVSGFDKRLADAVAQAKTDALKGVVEPLEAARRLPNTLGIGGVTKEQGAGYKPTGDFGFNRIPSRK